MGIIEWLYLTLFWLILPIGVGIILLPFTPYIVKKFKYKSKKPLPSLNSFSVVIISLVLFMSFVWGSFFNGHLYYEWDGMFVGYSLVNYEHPQIDTTGQSPLLGTSRMFFGWQVWYLYILWLLITLTIYAIAVTVALLKNRKHENFVAYRKLILTSVMYMTAISIITYPLLTFLMLLFSNQLNQFSSAFFGK